MPAFGSVFLVWLHTLNKALSNPENTVFERMGIELMSSARPGPLLGDAHLGPDAHRDAHWGGQMRTGDAHWGGADAHWDSHWGG